MSSLAGRSAGSHPVTILRIFLAYIKLVRHSERFCFQRPPLDLRAMNFKPLALPVAVLALLTLSAAARPIPAPVAPVQTSAPDSVLIARADAGRIEGNPSAKVWLVEASDFQCPFCKEWHDQSFATLQKDYVATGKVRVAFLNYPLSMHAHSMQAAEAAMCASAQDKFWPMHTALFTTQEQWDGPANPSAFFESLATKVGVNVADWRHCVSTHAVLPLIQADLARLRSSGVNATPTFFVGNQRLEGAIPLAQLRLVLDAALVKAGTP